MNIGKIEDINYERDTRAMYGEDAPMRFQLDSLLDQLLEDGHDAHDLSAAIYGKDLRESVSILQSLISSKP